MANYIRSAYLPLFLLSAFCLYGCTSNDVVKTGTESVVNAVESPYSEKINPVRVYFATNREQTLLDSPGEKFNYVISDKLSYGHCDVSIPPNHLIGEMDSPSMLRLWNRNDVTRYIVLTDTKVYQNFDQLANELQSNSDNLFIFIHGFNVGFGDAARRTAQMARDMEFQGKALFFSWPSRKKLLRYKTDSDTEVATRPVIEKFFVDLSERFPDKNFYVVAHSMGTSLFSETIINIAKNNSKFKNRIKAVVLAAPDIDSKNFKDVIVPAFITMNAPVTVYTSKKDLALMVSGWIWKGPRIGRNIYGNQYMDIIDASAVDADLIGHSYYGGSSDVIYDIDEFITILARANQREWLKKNDTQDGPVWLLPPGTSKYKLSFEKSLVTGEMPVQSASGSD